MNELNNCEDKKVDVLLRKVLKEEVENVNVPDRMKEELVEKIGRVSHVFH